MNRTWDVGVEGGERGARRKEKERKDKRKDRTKEKTQTTKRRGGEHKVDGIVVMTG